MGPPAPAPEAFVLDAADLIGGAAYQLHEHRSRSTWSFPAHSHRGFCEIGYVIDGSVDHDLAGGRVTMAAGDLLLIREHDRHTVRGRDFRFVNLNIPLALWCEVVAFLGNPPALRHLVEGRQPEPHHVPAVRREAVAAGFADLFDRQRDPQAGLAVRRFLCSLLADLVLDREGDHDDDRPAWLVRLLNEADGPDLATLDPPALARRAGKSAEHLARTFRLHLDTTPSDWLADRRLDRAALRLSHSDAPILSIALEVGFDHLGWFYRRFKRRFGLTPRAYRLRHGLGRR